MQPEGSGSRRCLFGGYNSEVLAHLLFFEILLWEILKYLFEKSTLASMTTLLMYLRRRRGCLSCQKLDIFSEVVREVSEHDNVVLNRESTINAELGGGLVVNFGYCDEDFKLHYGYLHQCS